jgi:hypothetical protein
LHRIIFFAMIPHAVSLKNCRRAKGGCNKIIASGLMERGAGWVETVPRRFESIRYLSEINRQIYLLTKMIGVAGISRPNGTTLALQSGVFPGASDQPRAMQ